MQRRLIPKGNVCSDNVFMLNPKARIPARPQQASSVLLAWAACSNGSFSLLFVHHGSVACISFLLAWMVKRRARARGQQNSIWVVQVLFPHPNLGGFGRFWYKEQLSCVLGVFEFWSWNKYSLSTLPPIFRKPSSPPIYILFIWRGRR